VCKPDGEQSLQCHSPGVSQNRSEGRGCESRGPIELDSSNGHGTVGLAYQDGILLVDQSLKSIAILNESGQVQDGVSGPGVGDQKEAGVQEMRVCAEKGDKKVQESQVFDSQ
jgi:hypothetical protein